ncbi:hypothetical protein [Treponema pedis]|uniref:hypothetical protein n=1 Tax=Treponema pedis TaxID=409322 RepID=UPI0003FE607B|nr:hypothetical protein [Treponema pedis]QSI03914.1 hypothetical protein DYQ05_02725 [Treponema pedis]
MFLKFKVPLIFAGAALALSFIIGILSGVRFSSILIRSIVLSLISGGFTLGAREILERFVPELFQPHISKDIPQNDGTGKKLNISIDDPIDMAPIPPADTEDLSMTEQQDNTETLPTNDDNFGSDIDTINGLDGETEEQNVFKAAENTDSVFNVEPAVSEDSSGLEELPDLQEFTPDETQTDTGQGQDFIEEGTGRFNISTDLSGSDMDTKTMVQAIRTVLKRES